MQRFLLTTLLFVHCLFAFSQFPDSKWVLGHSGGFAEQDSFGLTILDYSNNQLQVGDELEVDYRMRSNNTSITRSDSLVLYFNGLAINNGRHDIIVNGADMYLGEASLGYNIPQASLVLPLPESSDTTYFLINTHVGWNEVLGTTVGSKLFYSKISVPPDSESATVVIKNQLLIDDLLAAGQLTAVKHGNGRDWWIIWRYWDSNIFIRYLLSPDGLERFSDQIIGEPSPSGLGQAVFSPDGSKYVIFNTINSTLGVFVNIYDFDRCTGLLDNQSEIHFPHDGGAGGAAISPNSRFLYIPSVVNIYQYDLWSDNIEASRTIVATYDGFLSPLFPTTFHLGQLARDGKIYICSPNGVMSLTEIQYPNRPEQACQVNQHAIQLPVFNSFSIPNLPNPRLGPIDGSPCDTLGINNVPLANFRVDQDTSDYLSFYFQDLSAYEPAVWSWNFGDGTVSQDTSPVHTYQEDGTYQVCLTVINDNGSHTSCQTIEVGVVDTDDFEQAANVKLFPNPFQQQFSLVFNDYYPRRASAHFFDAAGQLIYQQRIFHGWNTIDGSTWMPGMYFYEVWDEQVKLGSGRIIKQ